MATENNAGWVVADEFTPDEVALRPRNVHFRLGRRAAALDSGRSVRLACRDRAEPLPTGRRAVVQPDCSPTPWSTCATSTIREEIVGFVGQEAVHARTHDQVLVEYLRGTVSTRAPSSASWSGSSASTTNGSRSGRRQPAQGARLRDARAVRRRALHRGARALGAQQLLGRHGASIRRCADLYRWHGAEEVEHRHVSYNVAKYFGMDYVAQAAVGRDGHRGRVLRDDVARHEVPGPRGPGAAEPRLPPAAVEAARIRQAGQPSLGSAILVRSALRLLRRDYNPVDEGSTAQAVAYLAASPAARACMGERCSAPALTRLRQAVLGEPPPGLYGRSPGPASSAPAGIAVPHFLSVVMRLGGDQELPELPRGPQPQGHACRGAANRGARCGRRCADPGRPGRRDLPRWHPGAHIDVHLPSGRTRQYSLCGDPGEEREYRIAVRHIPDGGGGSIEVHGLGVGQIVEISDPRNAFMMPVPGSGSRSGEAPLHRRRHRHHPDPADGPARRSARCAVVAAATPAGTATACRSWTSCSPSATGCGCAPTTSTDCPRPPSCSTASTGAPRCTPAVRRR